MSLPTCIFHSISDNFNFGKYKGLSLADVLEINPSYFFWCINRCDGLHFLVEDNVLIQIKNAFPEIVLSKDIEKICQNRFIDYENDLIESSINYQNDYYDEDNTYGRYACSYAQDVMGYSDDDIDTIFDGDPNAYWNID